MLDLTLVIIYHLILITMDWDQFSSTKFQQYLDLAIDQAVYVVPRLLLAFFILWVGFKIIKHLKKVINTALKKIGITETLRPFISSIINVTLKVFLFMVVANIIGADITGFVAIIATASFAVGMALQGSLGNFASGVLILSFRPYKAGDWVSVDDKFGKVKEIGIFNTMIITPGHNLLIVPNSKITDNVVTNFSHKDMIRLELKVVIPYEESYPLVEQLIKTTIKGIPIILDNPEPEIGIHVFDSHTIEIAVRPYTLPDDFWEGTFAFNNAIKKALHENNIQMAYAEGVEMGKIGE